MGEGRLPGQPRISPNRVAGPGRRSCSRRGLGLGLGAQEAEGQCSVAWEGGVSG